MIARPYIRAALIAFFLGLPGIAGAQRDSVRALRTDLAHFATALDSLAAVRVRLEGEVERLSVAVDSLKREQTGHPAEGALKKNLQRSLTVALALEDLYAREEATRKDAAAVRERLRDAYDRAIGALVDSLAQAPDPEKVARLQALRRARNAVLPSVDTPDVDTHIPQLAVRPDDGPEAIRQKAELMADVAGRVGRELAETGRRLKKLEEEKRLRGRVETFDNEMSLFDESLPEGRSVALAQGQTVAGDKGNLQAPDVTPPTSLVGDASGSGTPQGADVVVGREVAPSEQTRAQGPAEGDALDREIKRLQNERVVLQAQEKQVAARAKLLKQYLEELLGETP